MKRLILIAIAFLIANLQAYSQSFSVRMSNSDRLCFQIADTTQRTVEIIRIKSLGNTQPPLPTGDLIIPSTVKYKDVVYTVASIGDSAFADAIGLNSVSIPTSIKSIGKRAFSGCLNLKSIIFPSSNPYIGEDAFEKCISVSSISFGSDWNILELQLFADSESLKEIAVPARISKISGVKTLANLEKIDVDPNNKAFSSCDGLLYSKDGKTLYACPKSKSGDISIPDGTELIFDGAFGDCAKVTSVLLPYSVHTFAFDEFSSCENLGRIILMADVPPTTAKWNGATVFAIKSPNRICSLQVPKENLVRYRVSICYSEGEYETLQGRRKADIFSGEMMAKTSINRVKKLV